MAFTHVVTRAYRDSSGASNTSTESVVDNSENNFSDENLSLPLTANHEVDWDVVRTAIQSLSISCDHAVTIKTNSSGSPTETFSLVAGQNLIWTLATDGLSKLPFSADVTKLFITVTGSSGTAKFNIRSMEHI